MLISRHTVCVFTLFFYDRFLRPFFDGRDDIRRAMEALAAIQGRFHRLLTRYQLTHGRSPHSQAEMAIQDPIYRARAHTRPGRWKSDDGGRDDIRRAMEALAAIPGRFDRLLTYDQLSHTRSTRPRIIRQDDPMRPKPPHIWLVTK